MTTIPSYLRELADKARERKSDEQVEKILNVAEENAKLGRYQVVFNWSVTEEVINKLVYLGFMVIQSESRLLVKWGKEKD